MSDEENVGEAFLRGFGNVLGSGELCPRAVSARNDEMSVPNVEKSRIIRQIDLVLKKIESPIEQVALFQLAGQDYSWDGGYYAHVLSELPAYHDWPSQSVVIVPQVKAGRFRVDFTVNLKGGYRIGIECDGAAFHDEDKDAARDGWILDNVNLPIFRVSGSTIWRSSVWASGVAAHFHGRI